MVSRSRPSTRSETLSEHASKQLIASYGVPVPKEALAADPEEAARAAVTLGFPVVLKLCGSAIAHKTERDLVRLGLADESAVRAAAAELLGRARPEDGPVTLLVAETVRGRRELIAGLVRDPQFGPCVLLGLGGILAEVLEDVVFCAAPLSHAEARNMLGRLRSRRALTQPFRGEPAVDADAVAEILVGLARLGLERPEVSSVDLNPLIVSGDRPVAVDALVVVDPGQAPASPGAAGEEPTSGGHGVLLEPSKPAESDARLLERFQPLFHPRGIVVAGVSSHPGKFGFAALHNLLRFGYAGEIFPVKPDGAEVLGRKTFRDVKDVPAGRADLVFVCTPNHVNETLLRACAERGVRAAFVASGGYAEAGEEGRALQRQLADTADELGMLMVGPNGQGVISTPASMCAQIVAPHPPRGRIAVASQSGNLVSSFLNYAVLTGVGVSKAVSLGNCAQTTLADCLEYFAADPDTDAALVYVEGVGDGARFRQALARITARKPLVLVKGGVASEGQRAAVSHTGSLASDARVFDGVCRQLGVLRAPTIEEAFEWAASLVSQPLPAGRRTAVFTTAGGWGVLAADACAAAGLELIALPDDLREAIDALVPSRWSRNNPIDLAGGETRDTVPAVLDLLCAHPQVDAVIQLGLGIQAAQAQVFESGEFFPEYGLDRIVGYHVRQDRRFAQVSRETSERHAKPVLVATELAYCGMEYGNAGPLGLREEGRVAYPSAHRAVRALRALVDWSEFRAGAGR